MSIETAAFEKLAYALLFLAVIIVVVLCRNKIGKYIALQQYAFWGLRLDEKDIRISGLVVIFVVIFFLVLELLVIFGVVQEKGRP